MEGKSTWMVYKWVQDLQVDPFAALWFICTHLCVGYYLLLVVGTWDTHGDRKVCLGEKEQNEKSEQHQEEHFFCFDVHTAVSNYSTRLVQNEPITHLFKVIATCWLLFCVCVTFQDLFFKWSGPYNSLVTFYGCFSRTSYCAHCWLPSTEIYCLNIHIASRCLFPALLCRLWQHCYFIH